MFDFEDWETDAELYYAMDWAGLVEYRAEKVKRHPDDEHYLWALAEAYVFNSEYDKAISLLSPLQKEYPEDPNISHTLLDALFLSGKDETYIEWVIKPVILRLDDNVADLCYEILTHRKKDEAVCGLHIDMYAYGYPVFDEYQLMDHLKDDKRFVLEGNRSEIYDCCIRIKRENRGERDGRENNKKLL